LNIDKLAGCGRLSHFHTLVTCGAFTAQDEFLEVPELDMDRLETAGQEAVFALYLAEEKITPEVVASIIFLRKTNQAGLGETVSGISPDWQKA